MTFHNILPDHDHEDDDEEKDFASKLLVVHKSGIRKHRAKENITHYDDVKFPQALYSELEQYLPKVLNKIIMSYEELKCVQCRQDAHSVPVPSTKNEICTRECKTCHETIVGRPCPTNENIVICTHCVYDNVEFTYKDTKYFESNYLDKTYKDNVLVSTLSWYNRRSSLYEVFEANYTTVVDIYEYQYGQCVDYSSVFWCSPNTYWFDMCIINQ